MRRSGGSLGGSSAGLMTDVPGLSHLWVRPPCSPTRLGAVSSSCPGLSPPRVHDSSSGGAFGLTTLTFDRFFGGVLTRAVVVVVLTDWVWGCCDAVTSRAAFAAFSSALRFRHWDVPPACLFLQYEHLFLAGLGFLGVWVVVVEIVSMKLHLRKL